MDLDDIDDMDLDDMPLTRTANSVRRMSREQDQARLQQQRGSLTVAQHHHQQQQQQQQHQRGGEESPKLHANFKAVGNTSRANVRMQDQAKLAAFATNFLGVTAEASAGGRSAEAEGLSDSGGSDMDLDSLPPSPTKQNLPGFPPGLGLGLGKGAGQGQGQGPGQGPGRLSGPVAQGRPRASAAPPSPKSARKSRKKSTEFPGGGVVAVDEPMHDDAVVDEGAPPPTKRLSKAEKKKKQAKADKKRRQSETGEVAEVVVAASSPGQLPSSPSQAKAQASAAAAMPERSASNEPVAQLRKKTAGAPAGGGNRPLSRIESLRRGLSPNGVAQSNKCKVCGKAAYALEKLVADDVTYIMKKSGDILRAGIFLDFVRLTARAEIRT